MDLTGPPLWHIGVINSVGDFHDCVGNTGQRQLALYSACFVSGFGHAVNSGTGGILTDGRRALLTHVQQTFCSITAHAGENNPHGFAASHSGHTVKEDVH